MLRRCLMTYEPFNGTGVKVTVASGNSSWGYTTMFDGIEVSYYSTNAQGVADVTHATYEKMKD